MQIMLMRILDSLIEHTPMLAARRTVKTKWYIINRYNKSHDDTGYRKADHNERYLTDTISGVLETRLGALGDRIGKLLFKMAVEESMMMRLMAMDESLTFSELEHLRKWAIQTVRNTDGGLNFDDILRLQQ